MKYNSNIHSFPLLIKSIVGTLYFLVKKIDYGPEELIVVNYHGTPDKFLSNFEEQLLFFKEHFIIINPEQLQDYYLGKISGNKKPLLLLTFDDGLKNNLGAAEILEKHGLNAYFFIVPDFIDQPIALQKDYYIKYIRPVINPFLDSEPKDFEAMSWEDIKRLSEKGHQFGSHTKSHSLTKNNSNEINRYEEIVNSKLYIEKKIEKKIIAFCSINNTITSVGQNEKKLISTHYLYHFTTIPGSNFEKKDPYFIKRRNIECFWLKGTVCFTLGRIDTKRWKTKIDYYNNL